MRPTKADQVDIEERRAALIRLRREKPKKRFDSPEVLALGYTSSQAASKDFYRALEARRKDLNIQVTEYREEQNEILDSLLEKHLPTALEGDIKASELCLKLLERQAKLNGWEQALKAELSGPGGGPVPLSSVGVAKLRDLIQMAGDPDPDEDDEDQGDDEEDTDDGDNV